MCDDWCGMCPLFLVQTTTTYIYPLFSRFDKYPFCFLSYGWWWAFCRPIFSRVLSGFFGSFPYVQCSICSSFFFFFQLTKRPEDFSLKTEWKSLLLWRRRRKRKHVGIPLSILRKSMAHVHMVFVFFPSKSFLWLDMVIFSLYYIIKFFIILFLTKNQPLL